MHKHKQTNRHVGHMYISTGYVLNEVVSENKFVWLLPTIVNELITIDQSNFGKENKFSSDICS